MTKNLENNIEREDSQGVRMGRGGLFKQRRGSSSGGDDTQNNQNDSNSNDKYKKFRRGAACLIIGASLLAGGSLGLTGCITTGYALQNGVDYDQFYDSNGEYKLVGRNNDVWMEKIDGSEKRQITHTPSIPELRAYLVSDQKYIVYTEPQHLFSNSKSFIVPSDSNDSERKPISWNEVDSLVNSRK